MVVAAVVIKRGSSNNNGGGGGDEVREWKEKSDRVGIGNNEWSQMAGLIINLRRMKCETRKKEILLSCIE